MSEKFCENLKRIRTEKGYTQKEFAEKLGVAKSTYCMYENGKREPNLKTVRRISELLSISTNDLINNSDYKIYYDSTNTKGFIKLVNEMVDKSITNNEPYIIAFDDDEYTDEELKRIKEYAEFIKSQRKDRAFTINPPED